MSHRTVFTSITPIPGGVSRQAAVDFFHDHTGVIDLSPLVTKRHPIPAPKFALPDERACAWYLVTEKISYLPGGLVRGDVESTTAFHDLPLGLQTHTYAPLGLELREKWTVGGTLPGEAPQPLELGLEAPPTGLYIREDVEIRCSFVLAGFVAKTVKKAHKTIAEALIAKAQVRARLRSTMEDCGPASPLYNPGLSFSSASSAASSAASASASDASASTAGTSSSLGPPPQSDRPASWGGRRASPENRQPIVNSATMRHQSLYPHTMAKPLY